MAIKRYEFKESIYVTNEYFGKCDIKRQVLLYEIKSKKSIIQPVGRFKGSNLYYQQEADFYILKYWIQNYKKLVDLTEEASSKILNNEVSHDWDVYDKAGLKFKLLDLTDTTFEEFKKFIPNILVNLQNVVRKYVDLRRSFPDLCSPRDSKNELYVDFSNQFNKGIIERNNRFLKSGLPLEKFLAEEAINKFYKKSHQRIMYEYWGRIYVGKRRLEGIQKLMNGVKRDHPKLINKILKYITKQIKEAKWDSKEVTMWLKKTKKVKD